MRKYFTKQFNKAKPRIEALLKWIIKAVFELLKLTALAWCVLYFVVAPSSIEIALAAITVFAAFWFTKYWG